MGPNCTYSQDYRRRFSDSQLLFLLQRGLEEMEMLFEKLNPDLVVSFICVTYLDYLAYLFARAKGVQFLNLRPTRVSDRVSFSSTLNDPSPQLTFYYNKIIDGYQSKFEDTAQAYISRVRDQHGRYEGVISPSAKPALTSKLTRFLRPSRLYSSASKLIAYFKSESLADNHVPNPLVNSLYTSLVNPICTYC